MSPPHEETEFICLAPLLRNLRGKKEGEDEVRRSAEKKKEERKRSRGQEEREVDDGSGAELT
jgi:hypothetical protein